MGALYNWAGDAILRDTIMWNKRAVLGYQNVAIPTDIREWISAPNSEVIKKAVSEIDLPTTKTTGTFDQRAWKIWKFVAEYIEYKSDKESVGLSDFWLFPSETLTLRKGDCEDTSILMASLMQTAGISDHCIRVVLGRVISSEGTFGHAWVVYQNEAGRWCLLESTLTSVPSYLPQADPMTEEGIVQRYEPSYCFNRSHLWSIYPTNITVAEYVKLREDKPGPVNIDINNFSKL